MPSLQPTTDLPPPRPDANQSSGPRWAEEEEEQESAAGAGAEDPNGVAAGEEEEADGGMYL